MPTKVCKVKTMAFPVVMYKCESWIIKKAECQRIDAFQLWCWRRLLRVPCTAGRSNQSILKEISPEYSLEGPMWSSSTLATWCKSQLIGKDHDSGKDWRQEEKGEAGNEMVWKHHQLKEHESEQTLGDNEGQGSLVCYTPWGYSQIRLSDWTTTKMGWIGKTESGIPARADCWFGSSGGCSWPW